MAAHRTLRIVNRRVTAEFKVQHDGLASDGALQPAPPVPRYGGWPTGPPGTEGGRSCSCSWLAPAAPHISEELWSRRGGRDRGGRGPRSMRSPWAGRRHPRRSVDRDPRSADPGSTARSAIGSSCPSGIGQPELEALSWVDRRSWPRSSDGHPTGSSMPAAALVNIVRSVTEPDPRNRQGGRVHGFRRDRRSCRCVRARCRAAFARFAARRHVAPAPAGRSVTSRRRPQSHVSLAQIRRRFRIRADHLAGDPLGQGGRGRPRSRRLRGGGRAHRLGAADRG